MRYDISHRFLMKVVWSVIVISLFALVVFTPEINLADTGISSQNITSSIPNSRGVIPVSSFGVGYACLIEPVSSNISKTLSSSQNVILLFPASSVFHGDSLFSKNRVFISDGILHKSSRQVCQLLDLPPPVLSWTGKAQFFSDRAPIFNRLYFFY